MNLPDSYETIVEITLPVVRCPHCGGRDHKPMRGGEDQGDGSKRRKMVCRGCQRKFAVIVEYEDSLPKNGNDEVDTR